VGRAEIEITTASDNAAGDFVIDRGDLLLNQPTARLLDTTGRAETDNANSCACVRLPREMRRLSKPKRETQPYANTGARIAVIKSSLEQVESITGFNTELLIIESTVHR